MILFWIKEHPNLIIFIKGSQAPLVIRCPHSLKLRLQVKEIPPGTFRNFLSTRSVVEAIQLFNIPRLGKLLQSRVNIMAIPFLGDYERNREKSFASDQ